MDTNNQLDKKLDKNDNLDLDKSNNPDRAEHLDAENIDRADKFESYADVADFVKDVCNDLSNLFERMKNIEGMYDITASKNQKLCSLIPKQIENKIIKIAVVGTIKSGKSTFINSLLSDDILKRGAGVVTSVITRIKKGESLNAKVFFKSWNEINLEIGKALKFIPSTIYPSFDSEIKFDLRKKSDRNFLQAVKAAFFMEQHDNIQQNISNNELVAKNELVSKSRLVSKSGSIPKSEFIYYNDLSGLRPEIILISNALEGYEYIKDFIPDNALNEQDIQKNLVFDQENLNYSISSGEYNSSNDNFDNLYFVEFKEENFVEHKNFTGISSNAFFVKDVVIEVPVDCADSSKKRTGTKTRIKISDNSQFLLIDDKIEIADCQGSDSTDLSVISDIQDYLLCSNIVVYVISSRTGLREADIKFLQIIQKMGILHNTFFILNTDFNEHESSASLIDIEKSVKKGIEYFIDNPSIYTISSLFNLLKKQKSANPHVLKQSNNKQPLNSYHLSNALSQKDFMLFELWQREIDFIEYTDKQTKELESALKNKIAKERYNTIINAHIERLNIMAHGALQRSAVFTQFLSDDFKKVSDAAERVKLLKEHSCRFESFLDDSIKITVDNINKEIKKAVKNLLNKNSGTESLKVKSFIFNDSIYSDKYQEMVETFSLNYALYSMFQDFRSKLDIFMAHNFNISIIEFIQEQEKYIEHEFQALYQSFFAMFNTAFNMQNNMQEVKNIDLNGAKRILGLTLPKSSFATAYSAEIRADAMARVSFYSVMAIIEKLIKPFSVSSKKTSRADSSQKTSRADFNQSPTLKESSKARTLRESAKKMKKEMFRSVIIHFDLYQHHIEENYLFPLINAAARDAKDKMMAMFRMCDIESENIEKLISNERTIKLDTINILQTISSDADKILNRINYVEKNNFRWSDRSR